MNFIPAGRVFNDTGVIQEGNLAKVICHYHEALFATNIDTIDVGSIVWFVIVVIT